MAAATARLGSIAWTMPPRGRTHSTTANATWRWSDDRERWPCVLRENGRQSLPLKISHCPFLAFDDSGRAALQNTAVFM